VKISLINDQSKIQLDLDLIKRVSEYISDKFDKDPKSHLNIVFSDIVNIRKLNKDYRNVDSETDVLSFSYISDMENIVPASASSAVTIGEIFICPEVALFNIPDAGKDWNLNLEIILLIIHGMLHIYDYDHIGEEDRITMEGIQDSMLSDVRRNFGL